MRIIGIGHYGDTAEFADELARRLRECYNADVERLSLNWEMRKLAHEMFHEEFGLREPEYYVENPEFLDQPVELGGCRPATLWEDAGLEVRFDDAWLKPLIDECVGDYLIVSDVRSEPEADFLRAAGALLCKIVHRTEEPDPFKRADYELSDYDWDLVLGGDNDLGWQVARLADALEKNETIPRRSRFYGISEALA